MIGRARLDFTVLEISRDGLSKAIGSKSAAVAGSRVEIGADGEESLAVGREADRAAAASQRPESYSELPWVCLQPVGQRVDLLAACDVPQDDGIIQARQKPALAVGRDRIGPDLAAVPQSPTLDACRGVSDTDRVIVARGGDETTERRCGAAWRLRVDRHWSFEDLPMP